MLPKLLTALLLAATPLPSTAAAAEAPDLTGEWQGTIRTPGAPLGVRVRLGRAESLWSGEIDIPQQGASGLALGSIEIDGPSVGFAIVGVPGDPTFRGALVEGEIRGEFTQFGATFDFVLQRGEVAAAADPPRPQEPRPPYPYAEEEVAYRSGEIELAGTLTLPETEGPHPAVLLLSGSGPQDRDEEVFGHRPFLVIADHLTRAGIAVLRVDDRGVGGSSGDLDAVTAAGLVADATAGVRFLRGRDEIAPSEVGLLGHSEGATVAAAAAAEHESVAFAVLLAGPGLPGDEILLLQNRVLLETAGLPAEEVAEHLALLEDLLELAPAGEERLRRRLEDAREAAAVGDSGAARGREARLTALEQQIPRLTSPWFLDFLGHDPRRALRQLRVPVLALWGSLDRQVPPEPNRAEVEAALRQAGNEDFTVETLDGLNHLFQPASTGLPLEYARIETTIEPAVLERISEWITARTSVSGSESPGAD